MYFDLRIWRIAEAILHCSNLYRELNVPPETQIAISVTHSGLKNRLLGVGNSMRMMSWNRKCEEDEVVWHQTVPLGSIEATLLDLTSDAAKQLFVLFEFWQPADQVFREVYTDFTNSRV